MALHSAFLDRDCIVYVSLNTYDHTFVLYAKNCTWKAAVSAFGPDVGVGRMSIVEQTNISL